MAKRTLSTTNLDRRNGDAYEKAEDILSRFEAELRAAARAADLGPVVSRDVQRRATSEGWRSFAVLACVHGQVSLDVDDADAKPRVALY